MNNATTSRRVDSMLVWDNHACMPLTPHDASFLPDVGKPEEASQPLSAQIGKGAAQIPTAGPPVSRARRSISAL